MSQLIDEVRRARSLPRPAMARAIRESAGVSQARLAAELGVHRMTVARWESGARSPRSDQRTAYAALYWLNCRRLPPVNSEHAQPATAGPSMTRAELCELARRSTTTDLPTAGRALGIGGNLAYELHARGEHPGRSPRAETRTQAPGTGRRFAGHTLASRPAGASDRGTTSASSPLAPAPLPPDVADLLARIRRRPHSDFQRRHHRRRMAKECQAACRVADGPTELRAPVRLDDPEQRLAQLKHAKAHSFYGWEIALLVPAPVTDEERAVLR